jgi:hypothetical protein
MFFSDSLATRLNVLVTKDTVSHTSDRAVNQTTRVAAGNPQTKSFHSINRKRH